MQRRESMRRGHAAASGGGAIARNGSRQSDELRAIRFETVGRTPSDTVRNGRTNSERNGSRRSDELRALPPASFGARRGAGRWRFARRGPRLPPCQGDARRVCRLAARPAPLRRRVAAGSPGGSGYMTVTWRLHVPWRWRLHAGSPGGGGYVTWTLRGRYMTVIWPLRGRCVAAAWPLRDRHVAAT